MTTQVALILAGGWALGCLFIAMGIGSAAEEERRDTMREKNRLWKIRYGIRHNLRKEDLDRLEVGRWA